MGRIAIFLTSMPIGGAERIALNLSSGLVEQGHSVDLVLVDASGPLLAELHNNINIIDLSASRVATSIRPLQQYLTKESPDVLYSMLTECNIAAVISNRLAASDCRLVLSEHNTPTVSAEGKKDRILLRLAGITYPYADHIVAVSRGVKNDLINVVDLSAEYVSVIHNPIDVDRIQQEAREPVEHEWLVDESTPVILSAGRHAPQKGFDTLLRAFARLENLDTRLLLLGEGTETKRLKDLAVTLGVANRVDFPGFVDNPFKYMAKADIFVLSSWYEGFGNVLIEAMATGCPVVATDCPSGPSEILEGGTYGPLVPVKNEKMMSESIKDVLQDPIDRSALISRANDFSIDKASKKYERVLFSL